MLNKSLLPALFALPLVACGGGAPAPTITASEVTVSTDDLEYTLARGESFGGTFMVFGGLATDRGDVLNRVTMMGLSMDEAQPIFERYPDFHECKSAGAPLAQDAIEQLNIVPANEDVFEQLERTLAEHEESIGAGNSRVSVRLRGDRIELASARVEGEDVTQQLPAMLPRGYVLVQSAEIVDTRAALAGSGGGPVR